MPGYPHSKKGTTTIEVSVPPDEMRLPTSDGAFLYYYNVKDDIVDAECKMIGKQDKKFYLDRGWKLGDDGKLIPVRDKLVYVIKDK